MKFYLVSSDVAKRGAKRLRKLVEEEQLRHHRALDITAYVYGYRNWEDLLATFDHESPSSPDDSLSPMPTRGGDGKSIGFANALAGSVKWRNVLSQSGT